MSSPVSPGASPLPYDGGRIVANIDSIDPNEVAASGSTASMGNLAARVYELAPDQFLHMEISDREEQVPTGVEANISPLTNRNFEIHRVTSSGLTFKEDLANDTVTKIQAKYKELEKLIIDNLVNDSRSGLQEHDIARVNVRVNTGRQVAIWWFEGEAEHVVSLSQDRQNYEVYHQYMNELDKMAGAENIRGVGDLEKFQEGLSGYSSRQSALSAIDLKNVRKLAEMEEYAKDFLKEIYSDPLEAVEAMKKLSAAKTYLWEIGSFLTAEKNRLQGEIDTAKKAGQNASPQDLLTLRQVNEQLVLFKSIDMFAVNTALANEGPVVSQDLAGAEALSKKFETALKRVDKNTKPLTLQQKQYAKAAGALALPAGDQLLYQQHCEAPSDIPNLDFRNPLPEQIIIGWVRNPPDNAFSHIQNDHFRTELKKALTQANGLVEARRTKIEGVPVAGGVPMKNAVDAWLKAQGSATFTPPPTSPVSPQPQAATTPLPAVSQMGAEDEEGELLRGPDAG